MLTLKLGTRASRLALWQADWVKTSLEAGVANPVVEIVTIKTSAESFPEQPIAEIGSGVFSRELDDALLSGSIDLAVHSLKDLPSDSPPALCITAILERESPLDAFVSADGTALDELPAGARIGTGSPRRKAQILARRSDLDVVPLRGNVETRLRKITNEGLAGTILAEAGLRRLGLEHVITHAFEPAVLVPAVGQGAVAVATRRDDDTTNAHVARLDHLETRRRVTAERAFLRELRGGCQAPAGALATLAGDEISIESALAKPDGSICLRTSCRGEVEDGERLGREAALDLLSRGGDAILADLIAQ